MLQLNCKGTKKDSSKEAEAQGIGRRRVRKCLGGRLAGVPNLAMD